MPVKVSTTTNAVLLASYYLVDSVFLQLLGGCQSIMGDQGEDTAQYSIRPPDSAKFRAGAVKVRMQNLTD